MFGVGRGILGTEGTTLNLGLAIRGRKERSWIGELCCWVCAKAQSPRGPAGMGCSQFGGHYSFHSDLFSSGNTPLLHSCAPQPVAGNPDSLELTPLAGQTLAVPESGPELGHSELLIFLHGCQAFSYLRAFAYTHGTSTWGTLASTPPTITFPCQRTLLLWSRKISQALIKSAGCQLQSSGWAFSNPKERWGRVHSRTT